MMPLSSSQPRAIIEAAEATASGMGVPVIIAVATQLREVAELVLTSVK